MSDPNGLLYMQNRYYNPYLCRFINADPSGFSGGLNWYAYANGNPVSYLDPFGLGAAGEGSFSSWLDNNTYDFSPAGQFMSAYQQTQSQMQQFQSFQPDSPNGGGLSSFLNGTPFLGGAKMTAEQVFTGHDLITGESVEGLSWLSVAAIGASFFPLPLEAGAEEVAAEGLPSGVGGTGLAYDKLTGQGLYVLRDEAGAVKYIGRGDAPARISVHANTPGKDLFSGQILWENNLTKAQAKGLEQRLIDEFGGALRQNPNSPLLNGFRSFAPENANASLYRNAVTDDLWAETLKRLGL